MQEGDSKDRKIVEQLECLEESGEFVAQIQALRRAMEEDRECLA